MSGESDDKERGVESSQAAEQARRETERRAIVEYERLLDRVGSLAQTFGTARDLRSVYRALYDFALASTPCNSIAISLVERGVRTAVYACCGDKEIDLSNVPSLRIAGASHHTEALQTNRLIIIDDLQAALSNRRLVPLGFDIDPSVPQSSLIAPMSVMGRVVGSFEIQSSNLAAFNRGHVTAMRMAANLAAVAIENVRMLEREREHEEQLRQSQKMEAIGRLAGGVAHDFNNLLTAIIGYCQLIGSRLQEEDPSVADIKEIEKAGNRAASLTRQLLAFSRKQVLQPKMLDLNALVADLENMLARLIGEDIDLITSFDPEIGRVRADPGQIEQVLLNLVVNARDSMPHGGKIWMRTADFFADSNENPVESGSLQPGRYVLIAVEDTGSGMDRDTLSHIFEPFFTTKELGKGTGLGLSTVYGIVNQSGGAILVESELGKGTTFTIYLPVVDSPDDYVNAGATDSSSETLTQTVLVVEDEHVVRRLVCDVLRMNGYEVLPAADGPEALEACADHAGPIHLLLTDVVMPHMGGRQLAERVTSMRLGIKVLYMSGYTDDSVVRQGLGTEAAFIQKPFAPDLLLRSVRAVLEAGKNPTRALESDEPVDDSPIKSS